MKENAYSNTHKKFQIHGTKFLEQKQKKRIDYIARHRLDTPRLLIDNTCTSSKLKSVARNYMVSMDSVAMQTKIRCTFTQPRCAYISMRVLPNACVHVHTLLASMCTIKRRQVIVIRIILASLLIQSGQSV